MVQFGTQGETVHNSTALTTIAARILTLSPWDECPCTFATGFLKSWYFSSPQ